MKFQASCCVCLSLAGWAWSQTALAAPGEDPVTISGKVSYLQLPTGRPAGSSNIVHRRDLPDNAKAKIARYIARSYGADQTGMLTEKDVVSTAQTNGMGGTTCVQSLAPSADNTPGGSDQVVVIRGDLVNICR